MEELVEDIKLVQRAMQRGIITPQAAAKRCVELAVMNEERLKQAMKEFSEK